MKRVSKYKLENGKIYKIWNKRLGELIIFKVLDSDIKESEDKEVSIGYAKIYIRTGYEKTNYETDLLIFKDDILYELSELQLFEELL